MTRVRAYEVIIGGLLVLVIAAGMYCAHLMQERCTTIADRSVLK